MHISNQFWQTKFPFNIGLCLIWLSFNFFCFCTPKYFLIGFWMFRRALSEVPIEFIYICRGVFFFHFRLSHLTRYFVYDVVSVLFFFMCFLYIIVIFDDCERMLLFVCVYVSCIGTACETFILYKHLPADFYYFFYYTFFHCNWFFYYYRRTDICMIYFDWFGFF